MSTGPSRQGRRQWPAAAVVVLLIGLLSAAVVWWSRGPAPLPQWRAERWLPADAEMVAWSGPIGPAIDALDGLARRLPGISGLLDAVTLMVGTDLRDPTASTRAGLRRDAGWTAALWQSAVWVAIPVSSPSGPVHVIEQLRRRGHAVRQHDGPAGGRRWDLAPRAPGGLAIQVWETDGAAVLRLPLDASAAADPQTAWQRFGATPKLSAVAVQGAPGLLHVRWPWRDGGQGRTALHAALGPADLLLGGLVDKVQSVEADLSLDVQRGAQLTLALQAGKGQLAEIARYHSGFVDDEAALDTGDLLPDETPLLLRARINPALWQSLPPLVRQMVLPAAALQVLHPALSGIDATQLPAVWDGQLAVGILAVSDTLPLDPSQWPSQSWRGALRPFAILACKTDVQARELMDRLRTALETSAEPPQLWQAGAWAGWQMAGPEAPWALLRKGRALALVSGASAIDDLRRVAEGKFQSLGQVAAASQQQQIVQGRGVWGGGLVQTPRLVRALRRRGVPDYITQLVASVHTVTGSVVLDADALRVEVRLVPDSGDLLPAAAAGRAP
jgi:hypothetical protein